MQTNVEKPKKNSSSLKATLTTSFLVLSVAILLISGSFDMYFNFKTHGKIVADKQQLIAKDAATTVVSFIHEKFIVLEAAVKLGHPSPASPKEQKRVLQTLLGLQPAFRQVVLIDSQEKILSKASRLSRAASGNLLDRTGNDFFSRIPQAKRHIGTVYVDEVTGETLVIIAVPVTDIFSDFKGTLMAEVNLKFMRDLMDRSKIGETGLAYVVDRQGDLIAFGDNARILRRENIAHLKEVDEFIRNPAPADETGVNISPGINGTSIVGTYVPLGIPDWAVVIELPVREAYREVVRGSVRSVGLILVMAVPAGLVGVFLARRLAVPLGNLTETAGRIAGGQTGLQAALEGPAEVIRLARAFNQMTGKLNETLHRETERVRKLQREAAQHSQAESALGESEERYRFLVEKMNDGLGVMDQNGVMTYVNERLCSMIGYSQGEIIGSRLIDFFDEDNQKVLKEQIGRRREGYKGIYELTWTGKDGRKIPAIISSKALWAADGSFVGSFAVITDITERKRAEKELQNSETLYRSFFHSNPHPMWVYDLETLAFLAVNDAAIKKYGYSQDDFLSMTIADIRPRQDLPRLMENVAQVSQGLDDAGSWRHRLKDGTNIDVEIVSHTLTHEGRDAELVMANDITERKRAEYELGKHRDHLEELVRERTRELEVAQEKLLRRERLVVLGQLTATVSHELRNPLGVIRSSAFYLQRRLQDADDKVAKHIERIDEQVNICDTIVGDLLEYTRGRYSEKVTGELNPWLRQLLGVFAESLEVPMVHRLAPDVAPVSFDREKMRRAVVNLVTNAIQAVIAKKAQAAAEGLVYEPQVSITTEQIEDRVVVRIADNGIGMDEQTTKRAFEPLFTTRARGTGLGLAIVEKIVGEHNGEISLESIPQEGTTVKIVLPIVLVK